MAHNQVVFQVMLNHPPQTALERRAKIKLAKSCVKQKILEHLLIIIFSESYARLT